MSVPVAPEAYRLAKLRGVMAAVILAVLSVIEYVVAVKLDNPTWFLMPFIVLKGLLILDVFMHVRAIKSGGDH